MPRIKLITAAAVALTGAVALAACQPAPAEPKPAASAVTSPVVSGPSQAQTEDRSVGDPLWSYKPLALVNSCEIGAFTYRGRTYLVASSKYVQRTCAITLEP